MWPIRIDLPQITYARAREAIAPILPGGVIAISYLLAPSSSASRLVSSAQVGPYWKTGILLFSSYCVGFVLYLGLMLMSVFVLSIPKALLLRKLHPGEPSKDVRFRALATKLFSEGLLPAPERSADTFSHPTGVSRELAATVQEALKGITSDWEWSRWYEVVKGYFYKKERASALLLVELSTLLQSLGWSGIIGLHLSGLESFGLSTLSVFAIVSGLIGCLAGIMEYEVTPTDLVSDMLREFRQEAHPGRGANS